MKKFLLGDLGCVNDCYFCRRLRIGVGSVLIQVASGLIGRFGIVRLFWRGGGMVVVKKCGKLFGNGGIDGFWKGE